MIEDAKVTGLTIIEYAMNNLDFVVLGIVLIVGWFVFKPEKIEKQKPIMGVTPIDPNLMKTLDEILMFKARYYISQMSLINGDYNDKEISRVVNLFVIDMKLTLDINLLSKVYTIYSEDNFDIVLKQKFLNEIYSLDEKTYNRPLDKELFSE